MRDFSYKMQQMRDFRCKKHGREPGRPKKKMPKKKNANLISRPKRRKEGTKERRKEGGREGGTKEGKREKGKTKIE